jgi:hypothetical protein
MGSLMLLRRRLRAAAVVLSAGAAAQVGAAGVLPPKCDPEAGPVAARFEVRVTPPTSSKKATRNQVWTFYRDARQVALLKGDIEEIWQRDDAGRIRFERVFHVDQQVVDYSPGELATLNVMPDWAALSCFVDPRDLAAASGPQGAARERLQIEWSTRINLPARFERRARDGTTTRIRLIASFPTPPAAWPAPGARSGDYRHLDAADFGDMDYEPVVRKSETLDVRAGWRAPHLHD